LVLGLLAQRVVARGFSLGAVRSDR
jgi:hypothetical protein